MQTEPRAKAKVAQRRRTEKGKPRPRPQKVHPAVAWPEVEGARREVTQGSRPRTGEGHKEADRSRGGDHGTRTKHQAKTQKNARTEESPAKTGGKKAGKEGEKTERER